MKAKADIKPVFICDLCDKPRLVQGRGAGGKLLLDALQGVIYADDAQAVAQGSIVGEAVEGGGISFICLPAAGRMKAFLDALAPPTQSETA